MLLPWPIAALCRALGARFKPVVTPLNTPFIPRLDHLEDRRLMATNLFAVGSSPGEAPWVQIYDNNSQHLIKQIQPFPSSFTGGVRIVLADLNHDGQQDLVVAPGPGGGPNVKVYDGATLKLTASFFAYAPGFSGGVNIAVGDIGHGQMGIVTGTDGKGSPTVKVFTPSGHELHSFNAYSPGFQGASELRWVMVPTEIRSLRRERGRVPDLMSSNLIWQPRKFFRVISRTIPNSVVGFL